MDDEETMKQSFEAINKLAEMAAEYKVTLACKAHVGCAVYNTPTSLKMIDAVKNPYFGLDMDPSHIHRAGEVPKDALASVIHAMKHVHIRDCKGLGPSPGDPENQACGRGDIDLFGYIKAMSDASYDGPCVLEVIGRDLELAEAAVIAAESYGYMNACLKKLGAR
jgi:sugar phosphate isomerase/epimerase